MGHASSAHAEPSSCPINAPSKTENSSAGCPNSGKLPEQKESESTTRQKNAGAHTMQKVSGGGGCPYSGRDNNSSSKGADSALSKKYNVYAQEIDPRNRMPVNPNQVKLNYCRMPQTICIDCVSALSKLVVSIPIFCAPESVLFQFSVNDDINKFLGPCSRSVSAVIHASDCCSHPKRWQHRLVNWWSKAYLHARICQMYPITGLIVRNINIQTSMSNRWWNLAVSFATDVLQRSSTEGQGRWCERRGHPFVAPHDIARIQFHTAKRLASIYEILCTQICHCPQDMDSVIAVHNSMNDQTWQKVVQWEQMHQGEGEYVLRAPKVTCITQLWPYAYNNSTFHPFSKPAVQGPAWADSPANRSGFIGHFLLSWCLGLRARWPHEVQLCCLCSHGTKKTSVILLILAFNLIH